MSDWSDTGEATVADGMPAMVRVGALRSFVDAVTALGGDPHALLAAAQIEVATLDNRHAVVPFRAYAHLLERAAVELQCPQFGMYLAGVQARADQRGPLEIVMHNSPTVGEAFRYAVTHGRAFSTGTELAFECRADGGAFLGFEVLVGRLPAQRQAVEHALLLTVSHAAAIGGGASLPDEVWLVHQPVAPMAQYRTRFGVTVRFGRPRNGLVFSAAALAAPVPDADPELLALATHFIEHRYPMSERVLSARVRLLVERAVLAGDCTCGGIAALLGVHPRTLQRYLRAEGESFEAIKDGVRRDIALRYLRRSGMPLIRVAEILGYSETSVLSRSCNRWFSASPRQLRTARGQRSDAA